MLIRTKFITSVFLSLAIVLSLTVVTSWQLRTYRQQQAQINELKLLLRQLSSLDRLAYEYIRLQPERASQQWASLYAKSTASLHNIIPFKAENSSLIVDITEDFQRLSDFYDALVLSTQCDEPQPDCAKNDQHNFHQDRALGQLVETSSGLEDKLMQLIFSYDSTLEKTWRNLFVIFLLFSLTVISILVLLTGVLIKDVLKPLQIVQRKTQALREGQSVKELAFTKHNEIGGLIQSFNQMAQSITSSKELLEQQVEERTQKLAQSNLELQQFAYVASHDLQEPLRSISGYLSLVKERYGQHLSEEDQRFIDRPIQAAARMQELIRALLSLSRIGTHGREFEPVDCQNVLDQVCLDLARLREETDATITYDNMPVIQGDKEQIRQLFQNLLANGLKFKGDAPPVIDITATKKPNSLGDTCWEFMVRDNGIGFDQKFSENIFQIFQRLHSRNEYAGTGIGLAVCKKIVERHGGTIWADSAPGTGARFHFTLCPESKTS